MRFGLYIGHRYPANFAAYLRQWKLCMVAPRFNLAGKPNNYLTITELTELKLIPVVSKVGILFFHIRTGPFINPASDT
jgi:hypothetical protein